MYPNFDTTAWLLRICIVIICASLGLSLLLIGDKRAKILAVVQIILSLFIPFYTGYYLYDRKISQAVIRTDWEQSLDDFRAAPVASFLLIGPYITLIISTTVTIRHLIATKRHYHKIP